MSNDVYSVGDRVEGQSFSFTRKISGVTKLSPKIIKIIAGAVLFLFMLLMYAVDSVDTVDTSKQNEYSTDSKQATSSSASVPSEFLEQVSDGVPSANKGPSVIYANVPIVPAIGNEPSLANPEIKTQSEDKIAMALEEKRRNARDRAIESNGSISGFSNETAIVSSPTLNQSPTQSLEEYKASQAKSAAPLEQDDQNKQIRKENFLKKAESDGDDGYLLSVKKSQITSFELKAGSVIPGILKSAINSDLPGLIRGIVSEDVYDTSTGANVLIPKGSTIVGTYDSQVAYGQRRLLAVWTKLIFPDGSTLSLKGMPAADQEGSAGLNAEVDNHYMKLFGAALATSVLSAGYQLSQGAQSTVGAVAQTPGQTMASSLGQQLGQVGTAITSKNLAIQPTLTNPVGQRFYVNVTKDIVFQKPYN
ncbi:MAG: TrbI/VirB10 family protein [Methylococcales bacterium]|nr:TrbI/VirB10 family protein [Methylococcales bacterium]